MQKGVCFLLNKKEPASYGREISMAKRMMFDVALTANGPKSPTILVFGRRSSVKEANEFLKEVVAFKSSVAGVVSEKDRKAIMVRFDSRFSDIKPERLLNGVIVIQPVQVR